MMPVTAWMSSSVAISENMENEKNITHLHKAEILPLKIFIFDSYQ